MRQGKKLRRAQILGQTVFPPVLVQREAISPEKVFVYSFRFTGAAADIAAWWTAHPESVRFVQSIINPIDHAQHPFLPGESL